MTLPDFIYDFFLKIQSGILSPLIKGLTYIAPFVCILGLIACVIWVIFAGRKGPAVFSLVIIIFVNIVIGSFPTVMQLVTDWFSVENTVDISSANEALNQGLSDASTTIQGL